MVIFCDFLTKLLFLLPIIYGQLNCRQIFQKNIDLEGGFLACVIHVGFLAIAPRELR